MMNFIVNRNGKPETLYIKKLGFFKQKEIWLGDELLGLWPKHIELTKGVQFNSKSGDILDVKMNRFPAELVIKFNGQAVEGSASHPDTRIKTAYGIMTFISVLNLLVGGIAEVTRAEALLKLGFGIYNIVLGGILLILLVVGYNAKRLLPLAIGLTLFTIDAILMVKLSIDLKMPPNVGALIVRVMILIPWLKGCIEIYKRNKTASKVTQN